jgi:hypothetical protein
MKPSKLPKIRKSKEGLMNSKTKPHKDKTKYSRRNFNYWEDLVDRADGDLSQN